MFKKLSVYNNDCFLKILVLNARIIVFICSYLLTYTILIIRIFVEIANLPDTAKRHLFSELLDQNSQFGL